MNPIYYKQLYKAGIRTISDLLNNKTKWKNQTEINNEYKVNINFLDLMSILQAIPKHWKQELKTTPTNKDTTYTDKVTELLESKKPTKLICQQIILNKCEIPLDRLQKWTTDLKEDIDGEDWLDNLQNIYTSSISSKIRSFDYKFQMRDIYTNDRLHKFGKSETNKCYLCKDQTETIIHLYWECRTNSRLWERLKTILSQLHIKHGNTPTFYLLGLDEVMEPVEPITHLLCTMLKQYIHQCKCLEIRGTEQGLINKITQLDTVNIKQ